MSIFCYLTWYYPMGLYRNAEHTDTVHSRGMLMVLFLWVTMLFGSSFAHMIIAAIEDPEAATGLSNILSIMMYAFCGYVSTSYPYIS